MKVTNDEGDSSNINVNSASDLTREVALALWQKVIFERCDVEDYLEHYRAEKALPIVYSRIEEASPILAEALSDENETHVEGILLIGNDALHKIKIGDYARPKRGYFKFTDSPRLNGIALQIESEEETRRADAKVAAIAKRDKASITLEEVLELEDNREDAEIVNYIILKKVVNGIPENFYVKIRLEDGEIKQELTHTRAIPVQTAPSLDFHTRDYNSLKDIYTELRKIICAYIAFPTDSIAPDLIALGSVASYFREAYFTYPYFDFISSEPEAGKTTAMKVQTFLSYYGTIASSVTEALLFREIDGSHCFYGLDNIERLFASPKEYSSIIDWLLSSYSRDIPCKRLEKTEEGYEVRYFDGYCIKAFTHIRDFPFALRALRSRCIQVVMQNAKPKKYYPSADKFTDTRNKLYKARLFEFEAVKESYENLINNNILSGRTGDLYLPLLSIAKLVDQKLFQRVLRYATTDETERKELDSWNMILIRVLLDNELLGSRSTNEIRGVYEEALINEGLLKDSTLATRTVTLRLKKLGFIREDKKTDHKTWYLIDRKKLMLKAYDYDIINEDEIEKDMNTHTPQKGTLCTLVTSGRDGNTPQQGSVERGEEDKASTEEIESGFNRGDGKGTKVTKVPKRGVCILPKNVCDRCGMNAQTTEYNGEWLCSKCLTEFTDNFSGPHDIDRPIKITLNICDEKNTCQECNYGEKWGIELPYLVHYTNAEIKTVCRRCGERIAKESDLTLPKEEATG
jgi:hypothetical protein